jgi:hypothetical protein
MWAIILSLVSCDQGFFFLGGLFLPEVTGIISYREISEISLFYRMSYFKQILNSIFFASKQLQFISSLYISVLLS